MMMGNELGLNPLQSIQNIAVINGRPSIYGDALMALVQNHPSFGGVEESFDDNTMTATCTVKRKGGEKHTQRYSEADAVTAKLWGKQGPWSQYPKRMLAMRARGFALRNQFADALAGLITREEAEDTPIERDITPMQATKQDQINHEPVEYTKDAFDENFPKWEILVSSGKKTPEQIINMVSSKGKLTDAMITLIKSLTKDKAAA